jgi:glycosyltransferase involved in cell wall biosynthesis
MRDRPRIGYVPFSADLLRAGDRRRFAGYAARRRIPFEIAKPGERYDLLVLSQAADISLWLDYNRGKVVYDLIDSYLASPRTEFKQMFRGPAKYVTGQFAHLRMDYKGTVQEMCRRADAVVCTTDEQKRDISKYCSNVHLALDFHSSVARQHKEDYSIGSPIRIAWEGLGVNVQQLSVIADVLRQLSKEFPLSLTLVTDLEHHLWLNKIGRVRSIDVAARIADNVVIHPWTEDTCARILSGCDIGVIPLDMNDPFVSGKPENKLLLMWRIGLPVVCSATPAYVRAMNAAGTPDLACANSDEWLSALRRLVSSEQARRTAGQAGRKHANSAWSEDAVLARWDGVLESVGIPVN